MIHLLQNKSADAVGDWKDPFEGVFSPPASRERSFTLCLAGTYGTGKLKIELGFVNSVGVVVPMGVPTEPVNLSELTPASPPALLTFTPGMRVRATLFGVTTGTSGAEAVLV